MRRSIVTSFLATSIIAVTTALLPMAAHAAGSPDLSLSSFTRVEHIGHNAHTSVHLQWNDSGAPLTDGFVLTLTLPPGLTLGPGGVHLLDSGNDGLPIELGLTIDAVPTSCCGGPPLANTGVHVAPLADFGLGLLAVGLLLIAAGSRRRRSPRSRAPANGR